MTANRTDGMTRILDREPERGRPRPLWRMTGCARIPQTVGHKEVLVCCSLEGKYVRLCCVILSGFGCGVQHYLAALTHGARYMSSLRDFEWWHFVHLTDPGFQPEARWDDTIFDRDPERGRLARSGSCLDV